MPTVLITGASRGLGLEFARQYCQDGWKVIAKLPPTREFRNPTEPNNSVLCSVKLISRGWSDLLRRKRNLRRVRRTKKPEVLFKAPGPGGVISGF